jgi:Family of unknown function (DUF6174)
MTRRVWIIIGLIVIIIPTFGVAFIAQFPSAMTLRARERQTAEMRWNQRSFTTYQIELEDLNCIQIVDVRNEKITQVLPGPRCTTDARTITDLFSLIRRDGEVGARCITQGCACDDQISVRAEYHAKLGYPTEIYIRIAPQPNWKHADYWRYLATHFSPPSCAFAAGDKIIAVRSLTIVP